MNQQPPSTEHGTGREAATRKRILSVREILGDDREVIIQHGREEYRLRLTSNQKLILTK